MQNILNSKVEIVKNKINEVKAFNIADEMFSSDKKNKKIEGIKFCDSYYSLPFDLNRKDINPSKLELDSELIELLNAKKGITKDI